MYVSEGKDCGIRWLFIDFWDDVLNTLDMEHELYNILNRCDYVRALVVY